MVVIKDVNELINNYYLYPIKGRINPALVKITKVWMTVQLIEGKANHKDWKLSNRSFSRDIDNFLDKAIKLDKEVVKILGLEF